MARSILVATVLLASAAHAFVPAPLAGSSSRIATQATCAATRLYMTEQDAASVEAGACDNSHLATVARIACNRAMHCTLGICSARRAIASACMLSESSFASRHCTSSLKRLQSYTYCCLSTCQASNHVFGNLRQYFTVAAVYALSGLLAFSRFVFAGAASQLTSACCIHWHHQNDRGIQARVRERQRSSSRWRCCWHC
jgi:hypothetical protein